MGLLQCDCYKRCRCRVRSLATTFPNTGQKITKIVFNCRQTVDGNSSPLLQTFITKRLTRMCVSSDLCEGGFPNLSFSRFKMSSKQLKSEIKQKEWYIFLKNMPVNKFNTNGVTSSPLPFWCICARAYACVCACVRVRECSSYHACVCVCMHLRLYVLVSFGLYCFIRVYVGWFTFLIMSAFLHIIH